MTVLFFRHKAAFLPQARAALLYYTNYYQAILGDPDTGLSHTWSLSVEEQFYILSPALFLWGKSRLPQLTRLLIAVICSLWIYRAVLKYGFHVWQGYFYEAFDTRADQLLLRLPARRCSLDRPVEQVLGDDLRFTAACFDRDSARRLRDRPTADGRRLP